MNSPDVTQFLDELNHPFRPQIEALRAIIAKASNELSENIKWNGPNYSIGSEDRITMRIQPPKQVQLIFHCGAKTKTLPRIKLIEDDFGLLVWKGNDRAVADFTQMQTIENNRENLITIILQWLAATQ